MSLSVGEVTCFIDLNGSEPVLREQTDLVLRTTGDPVKTIHDIAMEAAKQP